MAQKALAKQPLTDQQQKVLDFVKAFIGKNSIPPTREEIADHFGFASTNGAQTHLEALEAKGHIELLGVKGARRGFSRGIRVVE